MKSTVFRELKRKYDETMILTKTSTNLIELLETIYPIIKDSSPEIAKKIKDTVQYRQDCLKLRESHQMYEG